MLFGIVMTLLAYSLIAVAAAALIQGWTGRGGRGPAEAPDAQRPGTDAAEAGAARAGTTDAGAAGADGAGVPCAATETAAPAGDGC